VKVLKAVDIYRHAGHKDADNTGNTLEAGTPNVTFIENQGDDYHLTWPGVPRASAQNRNIPFPSVQPKPGSRSSVVKG
jgi:hypothetical protein